MLDFENFYDETDDDDLIDAAEERLMNTLQNAQPIIPSSAPSVHNKGVNNGKVER